MLQRRRKPLEPVYLRNKDRYKIQDFYESLDIANPNLSNQVRIGRLRSVDIDRDVPTFIHARWGQVEVPEGTTLFDEAGSLNGRVSSTVNIAGLSFVCDSFALEQRAQKLASRPFFASEITYPDPPPPVSRVVDAEQLIKDQLVSSTQRVYYRGVGMRTETVKNSFLVFQFRQFWYRYRKRIQDLPDLTLHGNRFTSSLFAPHFIAAMRYINIVPTSEGPTYASADGRTWYVRVGLSLYQDPSTEGSLNTILRDVLAHIRGSGTFGSALAEADSLNMAWGPSPVQPVEPPPPVFKPFDGPVLLEELEKATHNLSKVGVEYIADMEQYESRREALLAACKDHLTNDFLPGWLDPTGANLSLDQRATVSDDGSIWHKMVNSVSVSGLYPPRRDINPWHLSYPRRLSNNRDAGDIADRISSADWNLLLAVKDLPEITRSLLVLAHVAILSGRQKLNTVSDIVNLLSDQWLNFNFGIAPTISDVKAAMRTFLNIYNSEGGQRVSTKLHLEGPRSALPPEIALWDGDDVNEFRNDKYQPSSFTHELELLEIQGKEIRHYITLALVPRTIVRLKGYYPRLKLDSISESDRTRLQLALAGLDGSDATIRAIGETLWDILPWSFILDYVADVSDYIHNYGAAAKNDYIHLAELSDYRFQGLELLSTHWFSALERKYGETKPLGVTQGPSFVLARYGLREFRRYSGLADLPRNPLKLSKPSTRQMLNIAALVGSRYSNKQ